MKKPKYKFYLSEFYGGAVDVDNLIVAGDRIAIGNPLDVFEVGDLIMIKGFVDFPINGVKKIIKKANDGTKWWYSLEMPVGTLKFVAEQGTAQRITLTRECYPFDFDKLTFKNEREKNQIFKRKKLSGKILFTNHGNFKDFNYLFGIEAQSECQEIYLKIDKLCGSTYSEYWRGKFSTSDGLFTVDKCLFSVEVQVVDKYTCILENGDLEYNILDQTNVYSTTYQPPEDLEMAAVCSKINTGTPPQVMPCNGGWVLSPSNFTGSFTDGNPISIGSACGPPDTSGTWKIFETRIKLHSSIGTHQYLFETVWFRQRVTTYDIAGVPQMPGGLGWINYGATTLTGLPATVWVRIPYNNATLTYNAWNECSGWHIRRAQLQVDPDNPIITYTRNRLLILTCKYLADNSCPSIASMYSLFFSFNKPGPINYVTGHNNKLAFLTIAQKSDIKFPNSSEPATIGNWSFLKAMDMLRVMFNAYWFIDENNKIRIEHLSFFEDVEGFDLTVGKWAKFIKGHHTFSYEKENRPSREVFKFMEASNQDFLGDPIRYPQCASKKEVEKEKTFIAELITTDLDYIKTAFEEIANEGFVILCNDFDGTTLTVNSEQGLLSGFVKPNGHLSWANLQENYHTYGRVLSSGIMNKKGKVFDSIIKTRKQVKIRIPVCCTDEFDPAKVIKTQMGWGDVQLAEESLLGDYIDLDLVFGELTASEAEDVVEPPIGLLQENGFVILQENGNYLLTED